MAHMLPFRPSETVADTANGSSQVLTQAWVLVHNPSQPHGSQLLSIDQNWHSRPNPPDHQESQSCWHTAQTYLQSCGERLSGRELRMCRGAEPRFLPLLPAARLLISPAAEVTEGQAVTLSCRSGLSPTPDTRFSWYLNGALLLEGPSSSLLLPAASSTDAGSYHCRAQDGHSASGPSSPAVLTVLCEQPPHWSLSALGRSVHWGPPATLASPRPC